MVNGLWNALPTPAFLIGPDDVIRMVNPAAEGFLNLSAKALIDIPLTDALKIATDMTDSLNRVRRNHSALMINDVDVGGRNRAPIPCTVQITPYSADGSDILLLVTPQNSFLNKGVKAGNTVKSAARSAIGMAEMLAHEIKNPLAGITGAAQLLAMNLPSQDIEMTDLIVSEVKRVVALLDQVEQFGNLMPPKRRAVNIHDVIDHARASAHVGFAAHMTLKQDYDPSLPPTWADADQLMQVISNLLKNAAQSAAKQGGEIRLRTYFDHSLRHRQKDGRSMALPLQIEIIDNGPGLPADIADDVFNPFVSGRENGTGLGLALVSKIISDHDGLIAVDSKPGRCAFRISLPLVPKNQGAT